VLLGYLTDAKRVPVFGDVSCGPCDLWLSETKKQKVPRSYSDADEKRVLIYGARDDDLKFMTLKMADPSRAYADVAMMTYH
jgi:hypothetical protein